MACMLHHCTFTAPVLLTPLAPHPPTQSCSSVDGSTNNVLSMAEVQLSLNPVFGSCPDGQAVLDKHNEFRARHG